MEDELTLLKQVCIDQKYEIAKAKRNFDLKFRTV